MSNYQESDWIEFKDRQPVEHGYYFIIYRHKDGQRMGKGIWWNGKEFKYKDYVTEVECWLPKRFDYYCPCMSYGLNMD